jgi:hypothetical protein
MNGYGKLRRCTGAQRQDRGLLPLPRRRARHDPPADPASPRATAGTPARSPSGSSNTYCQAL